MVRTIESEVVEGVRASTQPTLLIGVDDKMAFAILLGGMVTTVKCIQPLGDLLAVLPEGEADVFRLLVVCDKVASAHLNVRGRRDEVPSCCALRKAEKHVAPAEGRGRRVVEKGPIIIELEDSLTCFSAVQIIRVHGEGTADAVVCEQMPHEILELLPDERIETS